MSWPAQDITAVVQDGRFVDLAVARLQDILPHWISDKRDAVVARLRFMVSVWDSREPSTIRTHILVVCRFVFWSFSAFSMLSLRTIPDMITAAWDAGRSPTFYSAMLTVVGFLMIRTARPSLWSMDFVKRLGAEHKRWWAKKKRKERLPMEHS